MSASWPTAPSSSATVVRTAPDKRVAYTTGCVDTLGKSVCSSMSTRSRRVRISFRCSTRESDPARRWSPLSAQGGLPVPTTTAVAESTTRTTMFVTNWQWRSKRRFGSFQCWSDGRRCRDRRTCPPISATLLGATRWKLPTPHFRQVQRELSKLWMRFCRHIPPHPDRCLCPLRIEFSRLDYLRHRRSHPRFASTRHLALASLFQRSELDLDGIGVSRSSWRSAQECWRSVWRA